MTLEELERAPARDVRVIAGHYRMTAIVDGRPVAHAVRTAWDSWHVIEQSIIRHRRNCCFLHWKGKELRPQLSKARWTSCATRQEAAGRLHELAAGEHGVWTLTLTVRRPPDPHGSPLSDADLERIAEFLRNGAPV